MKKIFTAATVALTLGCMMSFPSFAAETRAEYRKEAVPIREELQSLNEEIGKLREEIKETSSDFKEIRLTRKETGVLSVDKETWKEARALHSQIREIRSETDSSSVKSIRAQAKAAADEGHFDEALNYLNTALEEKQERLKDLKSIHALWEQIDTLLDQS